MYRTYTICTPFVFIPSFTILTSIDGSWLCLMYMSSYCVNKARESYWIAIHFLQKNNRRQILFSNDGPWLWLSTGQRTCLLLRQSEFESRWSLQFFSVNFVFEKYKNKQKEAGNGPFQNIFKWYPNYDAFDALAYIQTGKWLYLQSRFHCEPFVKKCVMELFSRRRWRLVSAQVVSCGVYENTKQ